MTVLAATTSLHGRFCQVVAFVLGTTTDIVGRYVRVFVHCRCEAISLKDHFARSTQFTRGRTSCPPCCTKPAKKPGHNRQCRRRLRFRLRIPVGHIGPCYLSSGGRMKLAQPDPDGRFSLVPVIETDVPCLEGTSTCSDASMPLLHAKTSSSHRHLQFVIGDERVIRMWFPVSLLFKRFLVERLRDEPCCPNEEALSCATIEQHLPENGSGLTAPCMGLAHPLIVRDGAAA
jgi:hypothetical protein